jgi:hypothetical protein
MTLLFTEGFDHYTNPGDLASLFSQTNGCNGFAPGRYGGFSASLARNVSGGLGPLLTHAIPPGTNALTIGFAFQIVPPLVATQPAGSIIVCFWDQTVPQFSVALTAAGFVAVNKGYSAAANASSLGVSQISVFGLSQWYYCEIQGTVDLVNGAVTANINGVNAVSFAAQKTQAAKTNLISAISFSYATTYTSQACVDDFYCCDLNGSAPYNTFLGMCHVQTVYPSGPGTYTQFTPSNPNNANWQSVSEVSMDGDFSYNTASIVGTKDTFISSSNFKPSDTILSVQPKVSTRQDDTAARQIQTYIKSSTEQGGTPITLTGTYQIAVDMYTANPATGAAWTSDAVNTLEFGYNIVE